MTVAPFVSCVMPTGAGRERFVPKAVEYWSRQTLDPGRRELVIVDDSPDPGVAEGLAREHPAVTHVHVPPTLLGTKLNLGIENARGDVIQKWDDDDIYRPRFLEIALDWLGRTPRPGFVLWDSYLILMAWTGDLYWTGPGHKAGPSLCFDRELWAQRPFRDVPNAVDSHWIADHPEYTPVVGHPEELILVRHGSNTWQEFKGIHVDSFISAELEPWPVSFAEVVDRADLAFYDRLGEDLRGSSRNQRG